MQYVYVNDLTFSVDEIKQKINSKPVFVTQNSKIESLPIDDSIKTRLNARQNIKSQQILYFTPNLSLDFSFIELFNEKFNTFKIIGDGVPIFLYSSDELNLKTYNIETVVYSVEADRKNKYNSEKQIEESIDASKLVRRKCLNADAFDEADIEPQNIIMIYLENKPDIVNCFAQDFLMKLLQQAPGMNEKFVKVGELFFYQLPYANVYIESTSLIRSLKTNSNTLKLKEAGSFKRSVMEVQDSKDEVGKHGRIQVPKETDHKYYTVEVAFRSDIFPNQEMPSSINEINANEEIKNWSFFKDEQGNQYIRKEVSVFDELTQQASEHEKDVITVKIPFDNKGVQWLHSINDAPSRIRTYNGNIKLKQWHINDKLWRENDLPAEVKFHDDETKQVEIWYINGVISRGDESKPAIVIYIDNGRHVTEKWYFNGMIGRRDESLPTIITYFDKKPLRFTWYKNGNLHRENLPAYVSIYENDVIKLAEWYKNGLLHREGGFPAVIKRYENGVIKSEEWQEEDMFHREGDLPAIINRYNNGVIKNEEWHKRGELHREGDLPAVIERYENGDLELEQWYKNGRLHREGDFPAVIKRNENGIIIREHWLKDGEQHREGDLPAVIERYKNGVIKETRWFKNKKNHRDDDLPAVIERYKNGDIKVQGWKIDGKYTRGNNMPAVIEYYHNNIVKIEKWFDNSGMRHRGGGEPAFIKYDKNGAIIERQWIIDNIFQKEIIGKEETEDEEIDENIEDEDEEIIPN